MKKHNDMQQWLWPKFDAYVKQVVHAAKVDYIRGQIRESKVPSVADEIIFAHTRRHEDDYPSDHFYVIMDGIVYPMDDAALYDALQQLPDNMLRVLVLKFWHRDSEKEIAQKMNVTIRSCYTRRKKALALLRSILEDETNEGTKQ